MARKFTLDQRSRGRDVALMVAAVAAAAPSRDPLAHNVGDCGCGGGCNGAMVCPGPFQGGGIIIAGNDALAAPGGNVNVQTTDQQQQMQAMLAAFARGVPEYLRGDITTDFWMRLYANWQRCVPYRDAVRDCLQMVTVVSDVTPIAAGATETITIQPPNGILDVYYFDISVLSDVGAVLDPGILSLTPPVVEGCPIPSCQPTTPIAGRFLSSENCLGCCGRPFRAVIPRNADATPLTTDVTNNSAGAVEVQLMVRGFCFPTRICL